MQRDVAAFVSSFSFVKAFSSHFGFQLSMGAGFALHAAACREGRRCTPCSRVSPYRAGKGYTLRKRVSPFRADIAFVPFSARDDTPRTSLLHAPESRGRCRGF